MRLTMRCLAPIVLVVLTSAVAARHGVLSTKNPQSQVDADSLRNAFRPLNVFGSSRLSSDLAERQTCTRTGYALCTGHSGRCCPSGGTCCLFDSVVVGCCSAGYTCRFSSTGKSVCVSDIVNRDVSPPLSSPLGPTLSSSIPLPTQSSTSTISSIPLPTQSNPSTSSSTLPPPTVSTTSTPSFPSTSSSSLTPSFSSSVTSASFSSSSFVTSASFSSSSQNQETSSSKLPSPETPTPNTIITTAATSFATTFTGNVQSPLPTPVGNTDLSLLYQCNPCGRSQCSFNAFENLNDAVYSLIVGTPIENCQGSTTSITSTSGGSITIGDTWSLQETVGLQLPDFSISSQSGWSYTKSVQWSQSITITVMPGQIGTLVANIQYKRKNGTLKVGDGEGFPLISNQPINVVSYSSEIVSCDSAIPANISSPTNCTSSALGTWTKADSLSSGSLVPIIACAVLAVSLLV